MPGDYAESRYIKIHRFVSIGLSLIVAIIYGEHFGFGYTLRAFAPFALPLTLIWFSDSLSVWAIQNSSGWLNSGNADSAVRIAGWIILLLMLALRVLVITNLPSS